MSSKIDNLTEKELFSSLSWLITLRWIAGAGVLGAGWFFTTLVPFDIPSLPLYLIGVGLLTYNACLWWLLDFLNTNELYPITTYQWFARLQIGLDWAAMTLLLHYTGGVESLVIFYFLFHIAIASLLLPHSRGFLYVTLAPILVGSVALLEYQEIISHIYVFQPSRHTDLPFVGAVMTFFTTSAYLMAYFMMTISKNLRWREDELSVLYNSINAITSSLEVIKVLNRLAEVTTNALQCQGTVIRLLNKTGTVLDITGTYGLSEDYYEKDPIPVSQVPIDREALSGQTVLVADALGDERIRYPEKVAKEGICTLVCVPLMDKKGAIGVLRAYGGPGYHFTRKQAILLQAIADQSVKAIQNAQTYNQLQNIDKSKSEFVQTITHELRSPVQVALSLLNLLDKDYVGGLNEKQGDLLNRARHRLQVLQTLIDDLLNLAAGQNDMLIPRKQEIIFLNGLLESMKGHFETAAQEKHLNLTIMCPDERLYIEGNPDEVEQMIGNLLTNAIKYTQQGEVRLWLEKTEDTAQITIADSGVGIPREALPHLFEAFYRAKNAKGLQETGTGLGLSIVKTLVKRYKGKIEVDSIEGEGTTFTLNLPLVKII